jgi:hypothetical protein
MLVAMAQQAVDAGLRPVAIRECVEGVLARRERRR